MHLMKVAIAQFAPDHLNLSGTIDSLDKIMQSLDEDIDLITFGETWLSGYPAWIDHYPDVARWDHEPVKESFLRMHDNAIAVDSDEMKHVQDLAAQKSCTIVIGVNEKVSAGKGQGTIYNSLITINKKGKIANHHRKLMPTFSEKLLYGIGDGKGLSSIEEENVKIGGLICWEHWMPLTRQSMHNSGEDVHVAVWPTVHEKHQIASRHYAFEGRCYVLAVGQIMKVSQVPPELQLPESYNEDDFLLNGGSCIIAPNGEFVVEPIFDREELIVADLPMEVILKERLTLDTSGHYQRNDVFQFEVNKSRS